MELLYSSSYLSTVEPQEGVGLELRSSGLWNHIDLEEPYVSDRNIHSIFNVE
jgi:hypothetical protein